MACPHVGAYKYEFEQKTKFTIWFCCHVCILPHGVLIFIIWKRTPAGIAALFWDQQPNATTQELWNQIASTASTGAVKNAMGPLDAVATTLGTFKTQPATKSPLKKCPLQPLPLAPTSAPPPSSTEDESKHLAEVIIVSIVILAIAGAVGYWCLGQIKSSN
jgi:hypothetical protein